MSGRLVPARSHHARRRPEAVHLHRAAGSASFSRSSLPPAKPPLPRALPTASISSMKMMLGLQNGKQTGTAQAAGKNLRTTWQREVALSRENLEMNSRFCTVREAHEGQQGLAGKASARGWTGRTEQDISEMGRNETSASPRHCLGQPRQCRSRSCYAGCLVNQVSAGPSSGRSEGSAPGCSGLRQTGPSRAMAPLPRTSP